MIYVNKLLKAGDKESSNWRKAHKKLQLSLISQNPKIRLLSMKISKDEITNFLKTDFKVKFKR